MTVSELLDRCPMADKPLSVLGAGVPVSEKSSGYPEPFRSRVQGREKRVLRDIFGLRNFGVNLTTLKSGAESALLHRHSAGRVHMGRGRTAHPCDRRSHSLAGYVRRIPGSWCRTPSRQSVNRSDEDFPILRSVTRHRVMKERSQRTTSAPISIAANGSFLTRTAPDTEPLRGAKFLDTV
jgi:hypothetical protein